MPLTRRQFLKILGGSAVGAVIFQACGVPEKELLVQSPAKMPEDLVSGIDNWYATLCKSCKTNEGIVVRVMEGRAKKIEGNIDYPINEGKHSARCEAALQSLYHPDRIQGPMVRTGNRGENQWQEISWTDAISRLSEQIDKLNSKEQMVLATNPVNSHEGLVVENFTKKLGSRHIPFEAIEDTNLLDAFQNIFGQRLAPEFDIANADYLLSFGSDLLGTWQSPTRYSKAYGDFRDLHHGRGKFVQIEPRFSMSAANADKWVYVHPGQEGKLALSIAHELIKQGVTTDSKWESISNIDLNSFSPDKVYLEIGLESADTIKEIAKEFGSHGPKSLAIGGGISSAYTNGSFNLSAIYLLNHLVNSVGSEGVIKLNPTSALNNISGESKRASFSEWESIPGEIKSGKVKILAIRGADPIYSLPDSVGLKEAVLGKNADGEFNIPLIVSFASQMDETTAIADLVLPENNPLEDWGTNIPNPGPGYQTIGFQQPVVRPFFENRGVDLGTKNFIEILLGISKEMEVQLDLEGETIIDILKNSAKELFSKNRGSVKSTTFDGFWNGLLQRGGWWDTESKQVGQIDSNPTLPTYSESQFSQSATSESFHLIPFETPSIMDGKLADLPWMQATPDPISTAVWDTWVEININKANELGIKEGDILKITSVDSKLSIEGVAYPNPATPTNVVGIPIGQGKTHGTRYSKNRGANVLSIISTIKDEKTGALAWGSTKIDLEKTGRWRRLPKFEGSKAETSVDEHHKVIQITNLNEASH